MSLLSFSSLPSAGVNPESQFLGVHWLSRQNPLPTESYYVGNFIRNVFIEILTTASFDSVLNVNWEMVNPRTFEGIFANR